MRILNVQSQSCFNRHNFSLHYMFNLFLFIYFKILKRLLNIQQAQKLFVQRIGVYIQNIVRSLYFKLSNQYQKSFHYNQKVQQINLKFVNQKSQFFKYTLKLNINKIMKKVHKLILIYSIIFWLLVAGGIILMAFAFQKVPIGSYGLRVDYFSPTVDKQYYTNGLYHKKIGYYFVLYPSSKQYLSNQKLSIINNDLQKIQINYSFCYKINPQNLYNMYYAVALSYQNRMLSLINNLISSYFNGLSQSQSRISAQSTIINLFNTNGKKKITQVFKGGIIVQGIWINSINFLASQKYYQTAYIYSSSGSIYYESAAYNLSIANLQLNALSAGIQNMKLSFMKSMQLQEQGTYNSQMKVSKTVKQQQNLKISRLFNSSRIFNFYRSPSFSFY